MQATICLCALKTHHTAAILAVLPNTTHIGGMCKNCEVQISRLETCALHRRYMYGETLGRWRTADLLIGLAYLARREPEESPVADIAKAARPLGQGAFLEQRQALAVRQQPCLLNPCEFRNIHRVP